MVVGRFDANLIVTSEGCNRTNTQRKYLQDLLSHQSPIRLAI
ncbi:hypothetical protein HMPREF9566_01388 [Cutibacterium acnes HL045PA1]|nr:hypothetical protein HMPREF9566_01388 [Cutibacterium acnes HL045PA1]